MLMYHGPCNLLADWFCKGPLQVRSQHSITLPAAEARCNSCDATASLRCGPRRLQTMLGCMSAAFTNKLLVFVHFFCNTLQVKPAFDPARHGVASDWVLDLVSPPSESTHHAAAKPAASSEQHASQQQQHADQLQPGAAGRPNDTLAIDQSSHGAVFKTVGEMAAASAVFVQHYINGMLPQSYDNADPSQHHRQPRRHGDLAPASPSAGSGASSSGGAPGSGSETPISSHGSPPKGATGTISPRGTHGLSPDLHGFQAAPALPDGGFHAAVARARTAHAGGLMFLQVWLCCTMPEELIQTQFLSAVA